MTTDHALFFIWNGPREGREAQGMESFSATKAFWAERKSAGDIAGFEIVTLASSGNQSMPAGFLLVTGERDTLQKIRWENEAFLELHTMTMMCMSGYACLDGYAGVGNDQHMERIAKVMKK